MSESDYSRRRDELNRLLRKEEQEIREIIKERDQAIKDKRNVESAYADVQEKYERVLKSMLSLKEKEELLVQRDNENMLKVKELDEQLENFKEDAHRQVESEYQNWLSQLAETEATNMRLKAMIRKADLKVEKLEHELGQKNKENSELHDLCDDLINSPRRNSRQDH